MEKPDKRICYIASKLNKTIRIFKWAVQKEVSFTRSDFNFIWIMHYSKKIDSPAWNDRKVVDFPIQMGIETYKEVEIDDSLVKTALALGIYIGDIS